MEDNTQDLRSRELARGTSRAELLRKAALGGATVATAAAAAAWSAPPAEAETGFVPRTEPQAANTYLPVFVRTPADRPQGSGLGFYTGTISYNGTVDPTVSMGYFGVAGEVSSTLQLEGDWDCGPVAGRPHITELYWQIVKANGASRRPLYGMYDRTMERAIQWWFMVGNGKSDIGTQPGAFNVNWDDDTSQAGVGMFAVTPNRINLYGVTTGGVAATQTRLCLFSAVGQGSAISLTYGGRDAEGYAHPTKVDAAVDFGQVNFYIGGRFSGAWFARSATQATLRLEAGISVGDGSVTRQAIMGATGSPSNSIGNNNDWCVSDDGHLYFKTAGAWVRKV